MFRLNNTRRDEDQNDDETSVRAATCNIHSVDSADNKRRRQNTMTLNARPRRDHNLHHSSHRHRRIDSENVCHSNDNINDHHNRIRVQQARNQPREIKTGTQHKKCL